MNKNSINFEEIKPLIIKLCRKYVCIGLSEKKMIDLLFAEINKNKQQIEEVDKNKQLEYIENILDKFLKRYIKQLCCENEDNFIKIANRYINYNLKQPYDYTHGNLRQIRRLINFFQSVQYNPDPDLYIPIINNNKKMKAYLENIISENLDKIENKYIEAMYNDEISLFIKLYCKSNNINIEENDGIVDEKFYDKIEIHDSLNTNSLNEYVRDKNYQLLSKEEEIEFIKKIKDGDLTARDEFIKRNIGLILSVAKRYKTGIFEFNDFVQEGYFGIIKALEKFDIERGVRFSTYAVPWIKNAISRYIVCNERTIRLPINKYEEVGTFIKEYRNIIENSDIKPDIKQLAIKFGINEDEVSELLVLMNNTISIEELNNRKCIHKEPVIADDALFRNLIRKHDKEKLEQIINSINLREDERFILYNYYGLNCEPLTLQQIGEIFNVTRERIRQKKESALNKIRKSDKIEYLAEFRESKEEALQNIIILTKKKK